VAADDLVDEAAVLNQIGEVAGGAQQKSIFDSPLEMPVHAFDHPSSWAMPGLLRGGSIR
tara:strand:+ start:888 stop:1064 length:177 start_codon:yes stop_codon:yes gene_type:complete